MISEFINSVDCHRFFMPGHKGVLNKRDITEINGADALYSASGIIAASEKRTSGIYKSSATVYSASGSTLCIQAMLKLASEKGGKIAAARNSHISFYNTCALLGLEPVWMYPEYGDTMLVSGRLMPETVEKTLASNKDVSSVYVTSPDYMGNISDIASISKICKKYGVMLIVDNAHGAHLKFLQKDVHPISLGADLCCDSAHKTLPVLTGGAYLHASGPYTPRQLKDAMSVFGTTSPSYLILDSLDNCAGYLEKSARSDFKLLAEYHSKLKKEAENAGFGVIDSDITKLSLKTFQAGVSADRAAEYFRSFKIEPEYAGGDVLVFLMTPFNTEEDFNALSQALCKFKKKPSVNAALCGYEIPERVMSSFEAFSAQSEYIPAEKAAGRIAAQVLISCPPGVPLFGYGEKITESMVNFIKNSGNYIIKVVK